jgi:hypothetical protein
MNWTERAAAYQEAQVAFGIRGIHEETNMHYANMAAYNVVFSKAEIDAVVEHMRGFEPADIVEVEIKLEPGEPE